MAVALKNSWADHGMETGFVESGWKHKSIWAAYFFSSVGYFSDFSFF